MMKKLFMWSALLMTGFAFYSCDDVIDNPVQDESAVWTYSVNVSFDDFDFKGLSDASGPYKYEAPKTIYVFNEELVPLGTIATEAAPEAGKSAKYTGTLRGAIGDNLILTTLTGADYSKQDGTMKSILENGIVQTAKVKVTLYSNYHYTLATEAAKMENEVAIVKFSLYSINRGDTITVESDNLATEDNKMNIILSDDEDFNPGQTFLAIPTVANEANDYAILANERNGQISKARKEDLEKKEFKKGEVNFFNEEYQIGYGINFFVNSVDLTKWYAYKKKTDPNATGEYTYWDFDDDEITMTQSGSETLDSLSLQMWNPNDNYNLNLKNVRLGKDRKIEIGAADGLTINLIGENKSGRLELYGKSTCTFKGEGTINLNKVILSGWGPTDVSELTITKDMDLKGIDIQSWGKLTIADGVKLTVLNEDKDVNDPTIRIQNGANLKVGKGATLEAENKVNEVPALEINEGIFEVADNGIVTIQSAIETPAIAINNAVDFILGKKAEVTVKGGTISPAININFNDEKDFNFTLDEGSTLTAQGNDRPGIAIGGNNSNNYDINFNFNIAKDAKVIAEALGKQEGFVASEWSWSGNKYKLNLTGKGLFEAKSAKDAGMYFQGVDVYMKDGINVAATGGKNSPAIALHDGNPPTLNIAKTISKLTATSGMTTDPLCIVRDGDDAEFNLGLAAADFVDDMGLDKENKKTGVRTITPKAE